MIIGKIGKNGSFLVGSLLIILSLGCGYIASAPEVGSAATVDLNQPSGSGGNSSEPTQMSLTALPFVIQPTQPIDEPKEPIPLAPPPAIPESRRLTLEYPPKIRTGDSDVVRLTLEVDSLDNLTPTAEVQGNIIAGQVVQIPNLYDSHFVVAEARLDLAGPEVRPTDAISEPLLQGQSVTFFWSVRPITDGSFRGTVWLFLRFKDKLTGEETRKAISAQTIQIESTKFLGLDGSIARTAGGLGSVIGAILGFPFVDDVFKWLFNRIRGRKE